MAIESFVKVNVIKSELEGVIVSAMQKVDKKLKCFPKKDTLKEDLEIFYKKSARKPPTS